MILTISLGIWGVVVFLRSDAGNLQSLMQKLADLLETSRQQLPVWLTTYLPEDVDALKRILTEIQNGQFAREWLLENKVNAPSFKAVRRGVDARTPRR